MVGAAVHLGHEQPVVAPVDRSDRPVDHVPAIATHLEPTHPQQLQRPGAVAGQVAVRMCGRSVARLTRIDHHDGPARPRQCQGGGQPRETAAHHDDVGNTVS
jgi:hypothetical protein